MAFHSIEYAILFLTCFSSVWLLKSHPKIRVFVLLAASYIFYASWVPSYLLLIFFSSTLDFFTGKKLYQTKKPFLRKALLLLSLCVNLGILAVFKYFNFFSAQTVYLLNQMGFEASPVYLQVLLPVGISFYTFQSLSYTIDIYRNQLKPTKSYFGYLLFVSFFPQLVAGPIVRASKLLPQLFKAPYLTSEEGSRAIFLIAFGLVKKIAIADFLGAHLVDPVFSNPVMYSSIETLVAVYGYAFQIYADFSAYSDIAIGSAALLGLKIPLNFKAPYTAVNLQDFWQRWHISLSTWLRDYLYIPLGGSKKSSPRTYFNLLITMLIGGLWHGAALTFVFWGAIHGIALVITRIIQRNFNLSVINPSCRKFLGVFLTFHLVCCAWIFFRASDFETARLIFENLFSFSLSTANISASVAWVLFIALFTHWLPQNFLNRVKASFAAIPSPLQAMVVIAIIVAANQLASKDVTPFIYFQF